MCSCGRGLARACLLVVPWSVCLGRPAESRTRPGRAHSAAKTTIPVALVVDFRALQAASNGLGAPARSQRRPPTADRERTSADRRASPRPPTPTMRTPPSRLLRPEAATTARHLQCSPQPTTPWTPPPPPALSPAPLRSGPTLPAPQLGDRRNAPTAPTANDHAHTDTHRPPDDQLKPAERAYTGTSQPPRE
jgi:hypothetical protein